MLLNRVLVCCDGSEASTRLIPYARDIAERCSATVILLRVIESAASYYGPADGIEAAEAYRHSAAREYLEELGAGLQRLGVPFEIAVLEGSPGEHIVNYAARNRIDLILIATYTKRVHIGRMVFGSVTDYVLRHSDIPVLTIKPGAPDDESPA